MKKISLNSILFIFLFSYTPTSAWELQNLSLNEKVVKSHLIVVGNIIQIITHTKSDIAGVGNCYEGTLKVKDFLKGNSNSQITVIWCDPDASELLSYRRERGYSYPDNKYSLTESIWMLSKKHKNSKYMIAENMAGILPLTKLEKIKRILKKYVL